MHSLRHAGSGVRAPHSHHIRRVNGHPGPQAVQLQQFDGDPFDAHGDPLLRLLQQVEAALLTAEGQHGEQWPVNAWVLVRRLQALAEAR